MHNIKVFFLYRDNYVKDFFVDFYNLAYTYLLLDTSLHIKNARPLRSKEEIHSC